MEEKTRLFVKRERIRRALINTGCGETICLQDWEIRILLDWLKELERGVEDGNKGNKTAGSKSKVAGYRR